MYDESTKTLILKVIDKPLFQESSEELITGMAVYNAANVDFLGIVERQRPLTEEELRNEYETGDIQTEKQTQEYKEADREFKRMVKEHQGGGSH
jgi:ClpP class serine protease